VTVGVRLAVLLALGVVPIVLLGGSVDVAVLVAACWVALCGALVAVDLAIAASPRALRLERGPSARLRLGESAEAELFVTNLGSRRLRGVVRDAWEPSAGAGSRRANIDVPAGERRLVSTRLTPTRRGERRSPHVTIRSWGPLGVAARQATLRSTARVTVLPPFNSRRHLPSRLVRLRELDGQTTLLVRGQGTEFDSLREYVRGDDVRSIDWRATARRRDLVVRTWRPERDRRVVILLDAGRNAATRVGDEVRFDASIEAALLLGALASRAGDRVDVVAFDRRVRARVQGVSGAALLTETVNALSGVEPELLEPDWSALPGIVSSITAHRALVVLLTTADQPGSVQPLLDVVPTLARKHLVVVAGVEDPAAVELSADRSDREAVFRASAAERAILDRSRVHDALTLLGSDAVTAAPDELPPALADRYLALKAAGRL